MQNQGYDSELSFALFTNDKGENPKRPDYRGTIQVNGVLYDLSGWKKEIKNGQNAGKKFISGRATVAKPREGAPAQARPVQEEPDKDVPF